ncbi:MAG: ABC transporter substrate-binding protein [Candidatus Sulfotelmatobacter sp.]
MNKRVLTALVVASAAAVSSWAQTTIRVGAFPNITHPQAMVGKANGWFERAMGPRVDVRWTSFNAGPAAIEALFGGAIDMTYVGPNPAINGYVRSNGEAVRVVAGAASGGASLIVRNDADIQKPQDFHGKRVASPQFGNTQDVALRNWLKDHGMNTTDKGGDVQIIPLANPDQLTLFLKKELDAAWSPEPWATRLIQEGNGRRFLDERTLWPKGQFVIGLLVVNTKFLKNHPDLVKNWIRAHVELTDWINDHPAEAKKLLNQQIQTETGKALPASVLDESFARMQATYNPLHPALLTAARHAFDDGFLGHEMPDLSHLYDLTLLNQVLAEKGRKAIQ